MKKPHFNIKTLFEPELQLLILLSKRDETNVFNKDINWNKFIELCKKHRLVSHILKNKRSQNIIPKEFFEKLKNIQLDQIKRSLLFNSELLRIHKELDKLKIKHLFFKGSILSFEIYKDIGFRNFRDIDILTNIDDLEKTVQVLKSLNYKLIEPAHALNEKQKKVNYTISHHYHLKHQDLPVELELHWNLTNPKSFYSIPTKNILQSKTYVDFQSYKLPYISKKHNLVFLAAHGAIHQWYRLFWLKDFSELLANSEENFINESWNFAKELKLDKCFLQACLLSNLIYGIKYPSFLSEFNLKDKFITTPLKSINTTELKQQNLVGKFKYPIYRMQLKADFNYRFNLFFRLRTHFTDWETIKLPGYLFGLYYFLRPLLILIKLFRKRN